MMPNQISDTQRRESGTLHLIESQPGKLPVPLPQRPSEAVANEARKEEKKREVKEK
jgi:hypothetical protein